MTCRHILLQLFNFMPRCLLVGCNADCTVRDYSSVSEGADNCIRVLLIYYLKKKKVVKYEYNLSKKSCMPKNISWYVH